MAWTAPRTWTDGELENAAILNQHIRDNLIALGEPVHIRKTPDEIVNNSTTMQDDNSFTWPVLANQRWMFTLYLRYSSSTIADIKTAFTLPSLATGNGQRIHTTGGAVAISEGNIQTATASDGLGTATTTSFLWNGQISIGANAGNVTLQWAQNTLDATDTTVLLGSWLDATLF